jgi:hypothetical protein
MFLALELCLTAICAALAFIWPELGYGSFSALEQRFGTFAQKRTLPVLSVGLLALTVRLALLPILPVPEPEVHDEYSYLLLADTLAHGRLANPTHPMWQHFETFHENMRPTYTSMYYPGHGIFLAFGQVVMGHPFWGVWLSSGLMCAAICWALQGWMPPGWALLGGSLAVIRLGTFSYWADSYWGGTVAALGGALVLGALPRIKGSQRVQDAVVIGVGMAMLASTRPYEGLFFCIPILLALLWWIINQRALSLKASAARIVLPIVLVMAATFAGLGYYFWRVTGSPFTTPYQVNMRTYGLVYFPWQKIVEVPKFHHAAMEMLYRGGAVVGMYHFARLHPIRLQISKQLVVWLFYFGPVLTLPWLAWLFTRPRGEFWKSFSPELRFLLLLALATSVSFALTIYVGQPHYAAPLTAVFYAATLLVMRDLFSWRAQNRQSGKFLVRSIPAICAVLLLVRLAAPALHITPAPSWIRTWCSQDTQNLQRAGLLKRLENTPGEHLVIVRYGPTHDFILNEWVFNNADIDDSKVIWARDMGPDNAELLRYFKTRNVWLVEPDYNPPRLSPYAQ